MTFFLSTRFSRLDLIRNVGTILARGGQMQGRVQGICRVHLKVLQIICSVVLFSDDTVGHFKVSSSSHNNHSTTTIFNDNTTTATTTNNKRNNKQQ